jgi:hypothetical protein
MKNIFCLRHQLKNINTTYNSRIASSFLSFNHSKNFCMLQSQFNLSNRFNSSKSFDFDQNKISLNPIEEIKINNINTNIPEEIKIIQDNTEIENENNSEDKIKIKIELKGRNSKTPKRVQYNLIYNPPLS